MYPRIKKTISFLAKKKIDAFLVTDDTNISYLTERPCEDAWLVVSPLKIFYITDARYYLEAKQDLRGLQVVLIKDSIYTTMGGLLNKMKVKKVGFNGKKLSFHQHKELRSLTGASIRFINIYNTIENQRSQKDKIEIEKIKESLSIHKEVFRFLKRIIRPGITERQVFNKLDSFVRSKGVTFSFDPIIASGVNSCYPHAMVTERKICKNDIVLIDMGIDKFGYKSDLTRMFFLGKIPKLIRKISDYVKGSQLDAISVIRAGINASDVDKQARNYLSKKRLAKYFSHGLGHGVGLDIHELPILSKKDTSVLKEGMVVTVEPGVYVPNKFGIRIEDMVLITKQGCEVLSDDIN